ncbi:MAG: 3-deoxy-manno-octulosonate cytidylyltransferase [Elusimicrobiota bacterium]|jgi:3-deoxy-manno-octulosonate cytidylyltransferase (CMP-KDO synthetase)
MRLLVLIPARYGSTRLPAKVLRPLGGIPVVEWCRRAAVRAAVGEVAVATDHEEVLRSVESYGGAAVLTPVSCASGTDRVHAALKTLERLRGVRYTHIINLQGDEPFIRPGTLKGVAALLREGAQMSTAVVPACEEDADNPNVVKAVLAKDGRCLYFSRAPVPFLRPHAGAPPRRPLYKHIGIYGFSREALERFVGLKPSVLERVESLEQLRALEDGISIRACVVKDRTVSIDTAADLRRAGRMLSKGGFR